MLKEALSAAELLYQKANINTALGSSFETLARDWGLVLGIAGDRAKDFPPARRCPALFAQTVIELRKELYGRRILAILRGLGREEEAKDFLSKHFRLYLRNIIDGTPIPE